MKVTHAFFFEDLELAAAMYSSMLPTEAAMFSKNGLALGFDYFPENFNSTTLALGGYALVRANAWAVQWLILTDKQYNFLHPVQSITKDKKQTKAEQYRRVMEHYANRDYVASSNWRLWNTLSDINRNYLLSLLWLPEEPCSALEALAMAANKED